MEVIACDRCKTVLDEVGRVELPTVNPNKVYEAENQETKHEFADGWVLTAFPDPEDPVAITIWHECPDCV